MILTALSAGEWQSSQTPLGLREGTALSKTVEEGHFCRGSLLSRKMKVALPPPSILVVPIHYQLLLLDTGWCQHLAHTYPSTTYFASSDSKQTWQTSSTSS